MTVYIAQGIYQHEGGDIVFGVFTSEHEAREVAEKHRGRFDSVDVSPYTLDVDEYGDRLEQAKKKAK